MKNTIQTTIDGQEYNGSYELKDGILYVYYLDRSEQTQQGGTPASVMAQVLLGEMVSKAKPTGCV